MINVHTDYQRKMSRIAVQDFLPNPPRKLTHIHENNWSDQVEFEKDMNWISMREFLQNPPGH